MAFGNISNPFNTLAPNNANLAGSANGTGLFFLAQSLVTFTIVVAGLYTFWNLIFAGFMFMSAGGDSKAVGKAWDKIWQSIIGLLIVAASFIIAGVFGQLIFGQPLFLLTPRIFSP